MNSEAAPGCHWTYTAKVGYQVAHNTALKHLLPLLLVLLAFFYGTPKEACFCAQAPIPVKVEVSAHSCCQAVVRTISDEHSCCRPDNSVSCSKAGSSLYKTKDCCGMMGTSSPALANSIGLLNGMEYIKVNVICLDQMFSLLRLEREQQVAYISRDPPRLRGFGSSDSYLYKRAFLI